MPSLKRVGHHGVPSSLKISSRGGARLISTKRLWNLAYADLDSERVWLTRRFALPPPPPVTKENSYFNDQSASIKAVAAEPKVAAALAEKHMMSPRRAFGLALRALGSANPTVVALDADVKNSTYALGFRQSLS